jgi:hypothetical protein
VIDGRVEVSAATPTKQRKSCTDKEESRSIFLHNKSINKSMSRNSRLILKHATSNRVSKIKHHKSPGEDDDLDHSITTISHFEDIFSDSYWQK